MQQLRFKSRRAVCFQAKTNPPTAQTGARHFKQICESVYVTPRNIAASKLLFRLAYLMKVRALSLATVHQFELQTKCGELA